MGPLQSPEVGWIRTLVVDDSEFFAEMTAGTLTTEHDLAASHETDARVALDVLGETDIDCIVSDYQMPGMNGLEFLEAVRERHGDVPFILLTGRGDEEIASRAIAGGVSDYLLKLEIVEDEQYERLAKRIENAVERRQAYRLYELLVNNSPDVIAHVTAEGTVLAANTAMADLIDRSREELVGSTLSAVFPETIAGERLAAGRRAIDGGEPVATEDHYAERYFHNSFVPVDGQRDLDTFQLISRDITERTEREQALERQNERLDRFASVVSHDLRNPLNVARSSAELFDAEGENYDRLDRSLSRMENIIGDVLTLARQGEPVDEPAVVDFETMVRDAWPFVDTDEATLQVEGETYLLADAGRLKNLLGNLFRNASDHTDGPVTITAGVLEDGFYVADDGDGIPEDRREDIFDPGFSTARNGTGLGLSIVREIAQAHGWTVDVTESGSGGTRFDVRGVDLQEQ